MVQNPPADMPRITPYLYYNNLAGALEWLEKAFGFAQRMQLDGPDGSIQHAEMQVADGVLMMGGASEDMGTISPADSGRVNQSLYVYVANVDEHHEKARAAGAQITMEPVEMFWGDRMYGARDLEGHHWNFAQKVRDVAPEDMKPPQS